MYQKIKFIGKGSDGSIYEVMKDDVKYALKDIEKLGDEEDIEILRKTNYLQKDLDHPNIVKIFETYEDDKNIVLIMELCSESLCERILKNKLTENEIKNYLKQLIYAVKYIEEKNILHNDIKTDNILLCNDVIKLTDFGSAEILLNREKGTFYGFDIYSHNSAPEMNKSGYNYSIDIWQIGVVFYSMLFGEYPFFNELDKLGYYGNLSLSPLSFEYIQNNKIIIPPTNPEAADLLSKMMEIDPKKRITLDDALLHPYLQNFE